MWFSKVKVHLSRFLVTKCKFPKTCAFRELGKLIRTHEKRIIHKYQYSFKKN